MLDNENRFAEGEDERHALHFYSSHKANMASLTQVEHRNQDATVYVGNLDSACDEDILLELFSQVGHVSSVHMPKDKLTGIHNGYGFVEFLDVTDCEYAIQIMNMIKLYGRPIRVSRSTLDKKNILDVGANLFIGNLETEVDEKLLYDTFSSFGTMIKPPKVMRDDSGVSKGYGFVSYDSFEASDMAIECMHNQYLSNRQILVQYAFKKSADESGPSASLERHGSKAERMLAASRAGNKIQRIPNTMFAASAMIAPTLPQFPLPPVPTMALPPLPPPPLPPR